jgi:SM-20-related protein
LNTLARTHDPIDGDIFKKIINAIRLDGYVVLQDMFSPGMLDALFIDLKSRDENDFDPAGTGREQHHRVNQFVRSDQICWLDKEAPASREYFGWVEQLRLRLNSELFLGLFDYESHYAIYPEGAFYKKHVDAFRGRASRVLTTVLYLNPNWQPDDGGELLIYGEDEDMPFLRVTPSWGTMVMFLSEHFPHEVLPARSTRYSLTGWFRLNTNLGENLDPPS